MPRCSRQEEASDLSHCVPQVIYILHTGERYPDSRIFCQVPRGKMIFWCSFRCPVTTGRDGSVPWLPRDLCWSTEDWEVRAQSAPGFLAGPSSKPQVLSKQVILVPRSRYRTVSTQGWKQDSSDSAMSVFGGSLASAERPQGVLQGWQPPSEARVQC